LYLDILYLILIGYYDLGNFVLVDEMINT